MVRLCIILFESLDWILQNFPKQRFVGTDPNDPDIKKNSTSMEGTSVFLMSTFQYVIMAFVYSKGPPFRRPLKYERFLQSSVGHL